ncbi:GNAT family N-acetyltransferase [Nocardioides sp. SYSU DS0651]|uniref:GNAT family N-acetyltransferase n=1 Tax=Nocardioides sp. SYSU DS0651 TaxID=3415955 RepID=UPI003F4B9A0B
MTRPLLTTARLRLEPLTAEQHTDALVELDADPEVLRFVFGRALTREEVVREWMPRRTSAEADARGLGYWVGLADGRFVGWWCLAYDAGRPDAAELGYRLRRDAWGRGYATEGARALLHHAFGTVGLSTVWAEAMAANAGSRNALTKLGFGVVRPERPGEPGSLPLVEQGDITYQLSRTEYDDTARR